MKTLIALLLTASLANAATRYVDSRATGANNGTSWTDAWTSLSSVSSISAGDTVYISGGPSGQTNSYSYTGSFPTVNGISDSQRTSYIIGQDSSHNGTVVFNCDSTTIFYHIQNLTFSGDAGDGQMHFVMSGGWTPVDNNSQSNVALKYVDFTIRGRGFKFIDCAHIELSHIYMYKDNYGDDYWAVMQCNGVSDWGVNSVNYCTILIPRSAAGDGDDGVQSQLNGDFHHNYVEGYTCDYTRGQHQDGIQTSQGSNYRIYANTFINIGNYPIFLEGIVGGYTHVRIHDNLLYISDTGVRAGSPQGIAIGANGVSRVFEDFIVANNTIIDYGIGYPIAMWNSSNPQTWTNCHVFNNIYVNSGGVNLDGAIDSQYNVSLTSAQATNQFTRYALNDSITNVDFTLSASATAIGYGTNLTSYFSTDITDASRAASGSWDAGAYAYSAGVETPQPPTGLKVLMRP